MNLKQEEKRKVAVEGHEDMKLFAECFEHMADC